MRGTFSEHHTYDGFEWSSKTNTNKWKTARVGSSSDRTILGLPPTGPLNIEDVKDAFRLSALKWHPDKHQGPSQVLVNLDP
ncbi:heat shock protein binding [Trifolium pratense]|uniref:Heat shock protein binding n=1 Tax=Trifolium pratense TaxID=57577 RepID=A0A2K3KZ36_TRIPR|nr:heat shock protein binding [Trifolium pratense]